MYDIQPPDILILIGVAIALLYDPFAPFVRYTIYELLKKKIRFAPQNAAVFGIVWYILYAMIATAVFLIYLSRNNIREWVVYAEFGLFGFLLVLTKIWTPIFFGFHRPLSPLSKSSRPAPLPKEDRKTYYIIALMDAVAIAIVVSCFMVFSVISDATFDWRFLLPTILMLPTLLWTCFACYLTGASIYYS